MRDRRPQQTGSGAVLCWLSCSAYNGRLMRRGSVVVLSMGPKSDCFNLKQYVTESSYR